MLCVYNRFAELGFAKTLHESEIGSLYWKKIGIDGKENKEKKAKKNDKHE